MDTIDTKYYDGFEGYPEIKFILVSKDGSKVILSMWDGYFDSIMYAIEPKDNCWVGIAFLIMSICLGLKRVHGKYQT